jgi:HK97 family phage prohead protease
VTIPQQDRDRFLGIREDRREVALHEAEIRSDGPNDAVVTGYASLFEDRYDVFGGPDRTGGWTEIVDRGAFRTTLSRNPDVVLVLNHDKTGIPLARTTAGTLNLSTDSKGLLTEARLDRRDPMVQSVAIALEKRHMQEMSFAFRTVRHDWSDDGRVRRLVEVSLDKGDVSLVTHGANPNTRMGLVSALEALSLAEDLELELRADTDDPVGLLTEARSKIDRLLTKLTVRPSGRRTLTLREAEEMVNGLA